MTQDNKRKEAPNGAQQNHKRKKGGNGGKWTTSHQLSRASTSSDAMAQPGDVGIWVTCARHQEQKALREVNELFDEHVSQIYGIKRAVEEEENDEEPEDIEAAIKKEVQALKSEGKSAPEHVFTSMKMPVDCLLWVKTKAPIEPVEFVRRICQSTKQSTDPKKIKCRYLNRLTPITMTAKASEAGIKELAKVVLGPYFDLSGKKAVAVAEKVTETVKDVVGEAGTILADEASVPDKALENDADPKGDEATPAEAAAPGQETTTSDDGASGQAFGDPRSAEGQERVYEPYAFAIRPTIRNHNTLTRGEVIDLIAKLINNERHKVNLSAPNKVILVDIYQSVCGMSVVDSDWEEMKRYNLAELYNQATGRTKAKPNVS